MWALSVVHLGLPIDAFWRLTPRFFFALMEALEVREVKALWGAARICSVLGNLHRDEKNHPKPYQVRDFMPDHLQYRFDDEQATPEKHVATQAEKDAMVTFVTELNAAFGGVDLRNMGVQ